MQKRRIFVPAVILIILFCASLSYAQSEPITNGLTYLNSTQSPEGSWGDAVAGSQPLPATVSVIAAFQALNLTNSSSYTNALLWLQSQGLETTDHLSERIHALSVAGIYMRPVDLNLTLTCLEIL